MERYFEKIQKLDEERKRRWVIGISLCLAIMFLVVWLKYFSAITAMPEVPSASASLPAGISFVGSLRAGFSDAASAVGKLFYHGK